MSLASSVIVRNAIGGRGEPGPEEGKGSAKRNVGVTVGLPDTLALSLALRLRVTFVVKRNVGVAVGLPDTLALSLALRLRVTLVVKRNVGVGVGAEGVGEGGEGGEG